MMNKADDVVEIDDDFLSLVEAAEANALLSKRRKINVDETSNNKEEEGAYTAALRGSRSLIWQKTTSDSLNSKAKGTLKVFADSSSAIAGGGSGSSTSACFKCGKLGHWARDCGEIGTSGGGNVSDSVANKPCPCGLGDCLVLTANTEKNRGRKFYRCPVREENGGCGFFEWCDNLSGNSLSSGAQNYTSNSSFPELQCPCGAGSCILLTAKTGKNIGQQFYRCPANQVQSCGFFKWCSEHTSAAGLQSSYSQVYSVMNNGNNKSYSGTSGSSCFKCGQEGHWARDCPNPSFASSIDAGGKSASSGTCCKCSKSGHWAKDCPNPSPAASIDAGGRSASYGTCYKCSKSGHWARDCPNPSPAASIDVRGRSTSYGTCYKYSKSGHWARDCPNPSSASSMDVGRRSDSSGTCYKCSKSGHWARDCPN